MQRLPILILCGCVSLLAACGDDSEPNDLDTSADTSTDVVDDVDAGNDTEPDAEPDVAECEFECVRAADCLGLEGDYLCVDGCCEEEAPGLGPCEQHGDPCESEDQTSDDFLCDTSRGICLELCDADFAADTESGSCPDETWCFSLNTPIDAQRDGLCLPNECTTIFDTDTCDGTGTCVPFGNNASFCFTAGTAAEGEGCNLDDSDNPPASDICAPGLRCYFNECVQPCNLRNGDDDCSGDDECLRAWDATVLNRPGVCGQDCDEFEADVCDEEGSRCGPFFGRARINNWLCYPPADLLLEEGADCGDGVEGSCGQGLTCSTIRGESPVCARFCNPLSIGDGAFVDCAGPDGPGGVVIDPVAGGAASAYLSVTPGTYEYEFWSDDGIRLGSATIVANESLAQTLVIADGAEGELTFWSLSDDPAESTAPGHRIVNVAASLERPVVSLGGEPGARLEYGASLPESGYTTVEAGDIEVSVDEEDFGAITVAEDGLVTALIAGAEPALLSFDGGRATDVPEGQSFIRLINARDGEGSAGLYEIAFSDKVCVPGSEAEYGTCRESCDPYPRAAGSYGCDEDTDTCVPFDQRRDRAIEPLGYCNVDEGSAGPWESCSNTGFFGQDCQDYAACLDRTGSSLCHPLCEPYGEQGCAEDETCDGDQVIRGRLSRSWCLRDVQPGSHNDRCLDEGLPCAEDLTLCLDLDGEGPRCRRVCRAGYDDCAGLEQTTCDVGGLNPNVVPPYMGFCP